MEQESAFSTFDFLHGLLADAWRMRDMRYPTRLSAWSEKEIATPVQATTFGFVQKGVAIIEGLPGCFPVGEGMYFSCPGGWQINGRGSKGILISRMHYSGVFSLGGPIEPLGRLKYIDGCTDSLLVPPVKQGDPCLNHLHFPPGIEQTMHTHPSVRVGLVYKGHGFCVTPDAQYSLYPGQVFIIHKEGKHCFHTAGESMDVIAYHPDSDYGPTDEVHPMINRTIVDGVPASRVHSILTR